MIDLSRLPPPTVVETYSYEAILAARKQDLIDLFPADRQAELAAVLALESEPLTKFLEESSYREVLLRARVNDAARAVMLAYATGADLEHLAAYLGVERLEGETDDRLRTRTQMALEGFSTAGPVGAYVLHALSASAAVLDVAIDSPTPGQVRVTVLSAAGDGTPSPELLATVDAALTAETVRPLTDQVLVEPAEILPYAIDASLILYPGPDGEVIRAAAATAAAAYADEHRRIGHDITLTGLHAALHQPGVQRVILAAPIADLVVDTRQASYCTGVTVQIGGTGV